MSAMGYFLDTWAIANQFKIPVKFIGIGEKANDLLVFDRHEFVDSLFSLK